VSRAGRLCVSLALLAATIGCTPPDAPDDGASSDEPRRGGTLLVAVLADVDSWNPYTTQDATSAAIVDLVYPRLVHETGVGFEPWLAASWEFSDDRRTLSFRLEPNARWSDGTPVTCEDVRFTHRVQRSEELAWPGAFIKARIDRVECPDPRTAVFYFREAYPDQLIDVNDNAIVPAAYGEVPLGAWSATSWERRAVTCGPFRLGRLRPGQEAVLERDPGWWREEGTWIDRVVFRVYPQATGAFPRFLEGEVDFLTGVPPARAEELVAHEGPRLVELPSLSYTYLGWNVLEPGAYVEDRRARGCGGETACPESAEEIRRLQRDRPHPILSDRDVRTALTEAIDRQDLVDGLWNGHARVGSSPIVSALWAHDEATRVAFDPQHARALLERAGWRDVDGDGIRERDGRPLELAVIVNGENRIRCDALERVAANLAGVGVRVVSELLPRREFVTRARDKNFDVVLSGWSAGTRVDPQNLLHGTAAANRGNNLGSWSTPDSDALLDRAAAATDRIAARPLWGEWQAIFVREQPITILYEERRLLGLGRRVRGPEPPFLDPYQRLHEWWLADSAGNGD